MLSHCSSVVYCVNESSLLVQSSIVLHCLDYAMSSQTMIVICVISVTRIRFLTGSRTFLIMSLIVLSVIIYCVFFCLKMKKRKNE